jgi:hypothetical protein
MPVPLPGRRVGVEIDPLLCVGEKVAVKVGERIPVDVGVHAPVIEALQAAPDVVQNPSSLVTAGYSEGIAETSWAQLVTALSKSSGIHTVVLG